MNKNIQIVIAVLAVILIAGAAITWKQHQDTLYQENKIHVYDSKTGKEADMTPTQPVSETPNTASIKPSLVLISPNGGEVLKVGKTYEIKWSAPSDSGQVRLLLQDDRTGSRQAEPLLIGTLAASAGKYSWTVPSTIVPNGLTDKGVFKIEIEETSLRGYTDTSDNYFSIANPSVTVISPNGGETLKVGDTVTIRWNPSEIDPDVQVYIILANADALTSPRGYAEIATVANSGAYTWKIPSTIPDRFDLRVGGNYKIIVKGPVSDRAGAKFSDESNSTFTITN